MNTTQPYWSHTDVTDPISKRQCQYRRDDLALFIKHLPREDDDADTHIAAYASADGRSKYMIERGFKGADMILKLPKLHQQVQELGHLDLRYLAAIDDCLEGVAEELLPQFDDLLLDYFTPQEVAETLPTVKALQKFLERHKLEHVPGYAEFVDAAYEERRLDFHSTKDGLHAIEGVITKEEGTILKTALDKTAKQHNTDRIGALMGLVTGDFKPGTITLNYFAPSPEEKPTYLDGAGYLSNMNTAVFNQAEVKTRNLADAVAYLNPEYSPTRDQKTAVRLRDGHCRFPGCTVEAANCQIDHVFEWDKGGQTIVTNLQCLCKHHHNLKTGGRLRVFMDHNAVCTWIWRNLGCTTTRPDGPLAEVSRANWGQKWGSRRARPQTCAQGEKAFKSEAQKRKKTPGNLIPGAKELSLSAHP